MANFDLIINFNHTSAISNTIRYGRIDNTLTPTYTTVPGLTNGDSPYTVNVPRGQYRVYIQPVYSDGRNCPELVRETAACTGISAFSVSESSPAGGLVISYVADVSLDAIQVNITYPNGGFATSQHTNDGNDIEITLPVGLYGNYSVTISPVCDEDTGWIGAATAPIIIPVASPNNSSITNNGPVQWNITSIKGNDGGGVQSIYLGLFPITPGNSNLFGIQDKFWLTIVVQVGTDGTPMSSATLTTGTGSYVGSVVNGPGGATLSFANVGVSGGIDIVIT